MTIKKPTLPSIDNSIAQSTLAAIPTSVPERREFLERRLARYEDKVVRCKAWGKDIKIIDLSIGETCKWACMSRTSAIMALNILHVIRNAVAIDENLDPKTGKQTKKFHFVKMHILWVKIRNYGIAKLTVGEWRNGNIGEYCLTDFYAKINEKKKAGVIGSVCPGRPAIKPKSDPIQSMSFGSTSPCEKRSPERPLKPQRLIKRKGSNKKSTGKKNNKK